MDIELFESREALEQAIISQYDDPEDKEAARIALLGVENAHLAAGMNMGVKPDLPPPPPSPDPGVEPGRLAAPPAADAAPPAADAPIPTPEEILAARDAEIAELRTKLLLQQDEDVVRATVAEQMQKRAAEGAELRGKQEEEVRQFQDLYGEDAAKALKAAHDRANEMRAEQDKQIEAAEIEKTRAVRQEQLSENQKVDAAIAGIPELAAWRADAEARMAGDTTKDRATYDLAVNMDNYLAQQPEWAGKSYAERFQKVVEMVRSSTGAGSAGAPLAPDTKAMQEAIQRQVRQDQPAPTTMSDIQGGSPAALDMDSRIENLSAAELAAMDNLSAADISNLIQRRQLAGL